MSGPIRQQLAPTKRRITDQIDEAKQLLEEQISSENYKTLAQNVRKLLAKLEKNFATFQDLKQRWSDLASQDKEEQGKLEAESENLGILTMEANDAISDLSTYMIEYEEHKKEVEKSHESKSTPLHSNKHVNVKLPQLNFGKFNGNVLKWQEFWDSFESAIDQNSNLKPVDKFNYLKTLLEGEARHAITGLELTNENYTVAIDLLKLRYGKKQILVDAHYMKLMELPVSTNQINQLRYTYDKLEQHLRSLEALGENIDHRYFVSMITSKLPEEVKIRLEEQKDTEEWSVKLLREKLEKHISIREMNSMSSEYKNLYEPQARATAETLIVSEKTKSRTKKCIFCNENHWSDECMNFKTIESRKEKIKGRYFICLNPNHKARKCSLNKLCVHCQSRGKHHRSLCSSKFPSNRNEKTTIVTENEKISISTGKDEVLLASSENVLLQTATTELRNVETLKTMPARLLLDSGSHRSYITEEFANKLKLKSKGTEIISVSTFSSEKAKTITTRIVEAELLLKNGKSMKISMNVVPKITEEIHRAKVNLENHVFLWKDLTLADSLPKENEKCTIDILIGSDYYLDLITPEKIRIREGLYLLGSQLGWILTGRFQSNYKVDAMTSMLITTRVNQAVDQVSLYSRIDDSLPINPNLEDLWSLDSIGIKERPDQYNDERALEIFNDKVKFENNRYQVTWPWREEYPDLPNNFQLALGRLKSMLRRLKEKADLFVGYNKIIQDQLNKGIVEKVNNKSEEFTTKHYLPHQAIVTPSKETTKLRVVYDASAKGKKGCKSLHECLLRGPVLLEDLCGLLLRFRTRRIAILADIEKAFLQIGLQTQDRDVTRFLWLKDPELPAEDSNIQVYRFCRVPFGMISSPFLLGATVSYHLNSIDSPIADQIVQDIYVDNVVTGTDSLNDAKKFYSEAKEIFKTASMNLREWCSNSKELMNTIPQQNQTRKTIISVLGMSWNTETDTISAPGISQEDYNVTSSKRDVLRLSAKTFDPLGYFSPITIRARVFLQELWQKKLNWDKQLDEQSLQLWKPIAEELSKIPSQNISRYVGLQSSNVGEAYNLHCFCDASTKSYAAALYLQVSNEERRHTKLLFSKSRLAPLKGITIPRLELLAVLIGCRILKYVQTKLALPISKKIIWTDSQCVIHWMNSNKVLSTFVKNRLIEIKFDPEIAFRYINTKENPVDIATRGTSMDKLNSSNWWNGPLWLNLAEEEWPTWNTSEITNDTSEKINSESKKIRTRHEVESVALESPKNRPPFNLDERKFSSVKKLLRVTAWCLSFVSRLKNRTVERQRSLTALEISESKLLWDLYIQRKHFSDVLNAIKENKSNNLKRQLNLQCDTKGIIRCYGRISNADISDNAKWPILLPRNEHYTNLIIKNCHERLFHAGVSHTLSQIRHEYWIPRGRSQVQKNLKQCTICRRHEGGPYERPKMPELPKSRVTVSTPFSYVGVDYFGPMYVRDISNSQKVWVCLYTCLAIRAVHLEIIRDTSAEQFLLCFRRFIARRGRPVQIISDNAPQFKVTKSAVDMIWEDVIQSPEIKKYAANRSISWKFIIEYAPWMGGFYERLVGSIKRALRKGIGKISLTFDQLRTVLTEVEAVVNSRPLIYVGADIKSWSCISPADFISLNPNTGVPELNVDITDTEEYRPAMSSSERILDSWKKGQKHVQLVWNIWKEDYLLSLRERTQSHHKSPRTQAHSVPQVGEIVLIKEKNIPHGTWKIGRITSLIQSEDKEVRAATVQLPSRKVLVRPLNLLYPLECSKPEDPVTTNDDDHTDETEIVPNPHSVQNTATRRPTHRAAEEARSVIFSTMLSAEGECRGIHEVCNLLMIQF